MKIQYKRIGDDTFLVLVDGQKPIKGRLKNFMNGLTNKTGSGNYPSHAVGTKECIWPPAFLLCSMGT